MIDFRRVRLLLERNGHKELTDRGLLELLLEISVSNATALADLQASVTALEAAAGDAPTDVSAGIEAARTAVDGVTTQLGGTPPSTGDTGTDTGDDTGTGIAEPTDPGTTPGS